MHSLKSSAICLSAPRGVCKEVNTDTNCRHVSCKPTSVASRSSLRWCSTLTVAPPLVHGRNHGLLSALLTVETFPTLGCLVSPTPSLLSHSANPKEDAKGSEVLVYHNGVVAEVSPRHIRLRSTFSAQLCDFATPQPHHHWILPPLCDVGWMAYPPTSTSRSARKFCALKLLRHKYPPPPSKLKKGHYAMRRAGNPEFASRHIGTPTFESLHHRALHLAAVHSPRLQAV